MKNPADRQRITLAELERITGISYKTISKRLHSLAPIEETNKEIYYSPKDALKLLYRTQGSSKELDLSQERALLARMQTRKLELEIRKAEGDLIEFDVVLDIFDQALSGFKERLLRIPDCLVPSEDEMHGLITAHIRIALQEVQALGQDIVEQKFSKAV